MSNASANEPTFARTLRVSRGTRHVTVTCAGNLFVYKELAADVKRRLAELDAGGEVVSAYRAAMGAIEREAVEELRVLWKKSRAK